MSGTSPTLILALQQLSKVDARSLLKTAIKELIARDVYRVEPQPRKGLGKRKGPKLLLLTGPSSSPPSRALQVAHRLVEGAPSIVHDGRPARDLTTVAKHLARNDARREVLAAAFVDLIGMGLVHEEERRILGLFKRRVVVRTAGGDALLEKDEQRRERHRAAGSSEASYFPIVVDPGSGDPHDPSDQDDRSDGSTDQAFDGAVDGSFDGDFDGAFDSSFDSSFDSAFDSSFDSAFDSSFDSGFSDGGGGGGDGGGGGGGDGGGGGGGD
ncbi:hypothetical protein [Patulibacter sp.]|uniref:hypothetical protein n=1 Tax=Patulibacter sp. TaxID=1912859 RepID=UPI00271AE53B|nr:hypothetical protein [Patulibacter sp.]MDO9406894.1 hypothetical protein [Patulibacter sp.]